MDASAVANGRRLMSRLAEIFSEVPDPRVVGRCRHRLVDIIGLVILGVLCRADDWTEIEEFGKRRLGLLREFFGKDFEVPSRDTIRRVFEALNRRQFSRCLFTITQQMCNSTKGNVIAVDGKQLRRSGLKHGDLSPLHAVTAWAADQHLTLGMETCEDKSNEITAIPKLLEMLNLAGATVTIDAMGCQRQIAAQIREQKGHYLLGLKGNQSSLRDDMQTLLETAVNEDFKSSRYRQITTREKGHGRNETRSVYTISVPQDHPQCERWRDLRTLVAVVSEREAHGVTSVETRLHITSHRPQAKMLGEAIRKHWSIENSQHWILDVAFDEDHRRQRSRHGAANLAAVRRLALSMLRQEKTNKRGIKNKRLACAWDDQYLLRVLENAVI